MILPPGAAGSAAHRWRAAAAFAGATALYFAAGKLGLSLTFVHPIFKLFQALNPDQETTGVGLAIVKISVESTVGVGSTFRISIPV